MTKNYCNFCTYKIAGEYVFDSNAKSFKLNSINQITINKKMDNSFHLPTEPFIKVQNLEFYIVRLGKSKNVWVPDKEDVGFIKNSFITNYGICVFCDNDNTCFICETKAEMEKIYTFLLHHTNYCYVNDNFIIN